MPSFKVTTRDELGVDAYIDAEYFEVEPGWVTFKDAGNKAVAAIAEGVVLAVQRIEE